jgi:hypothetical protein
MGVDSLASWSSVMSWVASRLGGILIFVEGKIGVACNVFLELVVVYLFAIFSREDNLPRLLLR